MRRRWSMLRVVRSRPPELREETYTKHPDLWDQVTTFFFVRGSLTSFYKYEEWIYSIFTAEKWTRTSMLLSQPAPPALISPSPSLTIYDRPHACLCDCAVPGCRGQRFCPRASSKASPPHCTAQNGLRDSEVFASLCAFLHVHVQAALIQRIFIEQQ